MALYQLQQYAGAARSGGASQEELLQDAYAIVTTGTVERTGRLVQIQLLRERLLGVNGLLKGPQ